VALALAGCGGGSDDPATERLRDADARLEDRPRDPDALAAVIRAAHAGATKNVDKITGGYTSDARPFLDRAAAVWPSYVAVTRERPDAAVASVMSVVFADGLKRPGDAAEAQRYATEARSSATAYLRLAYLYARAGDRRLADLSGQKALELADPSERDRVRATIRQLRRTPG
jgi:hypothetical protein